MKRNITLGILFISALALSSCSTQNKLASTKVEDDVYFTQAKAGDAPVYASNEPKTYREDNYATPVATNDDYYYYDSYEARLNRFYGYSPYGSSYYSDMFYGGYNPFNPYYSGLSIGLGYGFGVFGYNPFYGYNPYYSYSPFGYYNPVYGYGGSSYWGPYSYYNTVPSYTTFAPNRPYRGSGLPGSTVGYTGTGYTGYGTAGSYPPPTTARPVRTSVVGGSSNNGQVVTQRPARTQTVQPQPQYTPQQQQYTPPPSNNNSGSSSGGSSSSGSSSGGGRPVRP